MAAHASTKGYLPAVVFTLALLLLIAFGAATAVSRFIYFMLPAVVLTVSFFFFLFPGSRLFSLALANSLAVYTCLFVLLAKLNFAEHIEFWEAYAGFAAPLAGLMLGCWYRRKTIRAFVLSGQERQKQRGYGRILLWLTPLLAIALATSWVRHVVEPEHHYDSLFLGAMFLAGVLVFFVSQDISIFLLRTGLAFEEFFTRVKGLLAPVYAFTTFYTLNVIVFACLYRIVDRIFEAPQFVVRGQPSEIDFIDSLYFSIITLSTVGYGDIVPAAPLIQALVAIQIVVGVLLLLFGFNEILGYARTHKEPPDG